MDNLIIEDIKYICKEIKPMGFSYTNNLGRMRILTPVGAVAFSSNNPLDQDFWKGIGSLFLQRTIEAINISYYSEGLQAIISPGYDCPWESRVIDMQLCVER